VKVSLSEKISTEGMQLLSFIVSEELMKIKEIEENENHTAGRKFDVG
jgi:hypothetical protein